ncbi:MAG: ATP-binding protein [Clostridiales bacterium]|jgi:AAA+ ATPase superfamily predicted ATPase|nr:ATP-binding protein [Clostridiales bacterium]
MFIGRQKELNTLKRQYEKNEFTFIPVYGRRRVGKTQLIEEFIRDKKAIFFTGVNKELYRDQIFRLSRAIFDNSEFAPVFNDFDKALDTVYLTAQNEKLIFVIDEFPYLASANESVVSVLQQFIDLKFLKTNMMLILAGSSMSFMENQVLSTQSPLYGRRTGQIKLLPVDFQTSRAFVPKLAKVDQAVIYGVTGGIPKYLSLFNDNLSLDENLTTQFFDKDEYLFEEPVNLLKQEYTDHSLYQAIITAIASGGSQMKDIKGRTGEESSTIATYIKSLLDTGIIKKEVPVMDKPESRKTLYRLDDGMFRFWYRFVYPNVSLVALNKGDLVYNRIKPQISDFMGETFEKICIEYMWSMYDSLPFQFQNIGRWWGNNPDLKSQSEIDFLAYSENREQAIFGECKWRNEPLDKSIIDELTVKCNMFRSFTQKYYYLFSKSGFTSGAQKYADGINNIRLIDFGDIF